MTTIGTNSQYLSNLMQQAGTQAHSPLPVTKGASSSREEVEKTAKDFEAVFISEMLRLMFKDVSADPLFGTTEADTIYRDMLLDKYGEKISNAGGFGIAPHIQNELLKLQEVA